LKNVGVQEEIAKKDEKMACLTILSFLHTKEKMIKKLIYLKNA